MRPLILAVSLRGRSMGLLYRVFVLIMVAGFVTVPSSGRAEESPSTPESMFSNSGDLDQSQLVIDDFVDQETLERVIILLNGSILYLPYHPHMRPKDYWRREDVEGVIRADLL